MAIPKSSIPTVSFLIIFSTLLLSVESRTDTNTLFSPCGDTKVQRKDGFTFGISFASRSAFFLNNNNSVQLSPCDNRLSLSNGNSQAAVFRPKVDEISLLTINTSNFFPESVGGYMVAFAGRKYAARSIPAFVANSTFTVTSFTLVLEFKKGRLQNLYWKRDGCTSCSGNSNFVCLNNQDCAIRTNNCKNRGGSVDCSLGIQLTFSGTDKHNSVLNSWYEVQNLRQYSLYESGWLCIFEFLHELTNENDVLDFERVFHGQLQMVETDIVPNKIWLRVLCLSFLKGESKFMLMVKRGGDMDASPSDVISCSTMNGSFSVTCLRSVKRKVDEFKEEKRFTVPGLIIPQNARVELGNECMALRETVSSQQQTIQDLIVELEEERNAASSAANEAMSMILRLQREKAEIQIEAKQFKRFVEEKMVHDQQELLALEDLLYKREQSIQSLTCEVQAYKHRMMSYGLTEAEADGENNMSRNNSMAENLNGQFELPPYELYPALKCNFHESQANPDGDDEAADVEKYAFGETPGSQVQLKDLEYRIDQLEKSPKNIQPEAELFGAKNMLEKVIVGQSPRRPRHSRKFSDDSSNSFFATGEDLDPDSFTDSPKLSGSFRNRFSQMENSNFKKMDNASEVGEDMSDRVYTIDSVHQEAPYNGLMEPKASVGMGDDYTATAPSKSLNFSDVKDLDIQKLYARLQALEADRESMRQAIISIGTDKAQFVLLKEIAQNLCKEMTPERRMTVKKPAVVRSFSFMAIFKWIITLIFWRRKVRRCRYMFGLSSHNAGLLMLIDREPRVGQWRCLSSTQV
ncbi:unnamed protein product [Fraxinus pennsylvanica]|uniref:GTD-binding domain-containing protein n=1 Tax=Fraxinus pennsylvanica TaxID=56036 RepID=A0AAD2A797_9LAMI|nr:unnamed protein product [Fraxinus pennsylvanica]